jgi:hypothetical protein
VAEEAAVVHCGRQHTIRRFTVKAVLISTYEMGRQPFGLASAGGVAPSCGLGRGVHRCGEEKLSSASLSAADLVGFHLPMHTATRLAVPVITKVRN